MLPRRTRVPPLGRLVRWCAPVVLALGTSACAPLPPTKEGLETNHLYYFFSYIALFVFLLVLALIAWSIIRYRARDDDDSKIPPQFKRNLPLEITYFAIPQLIVIALFVASVFVIHDVNAEPNRVGSHDPLIIDVTGFQWGWDLHYVKAGVTVESLPHDVATFYLPTDTPIRFNLRSRDVIHSFFIPEFMMKRDVIPGVHNSFQVSGIDKPGTYHLHCAEFCGLLHDRMYASIKAVPKAQFQSWLSSQPRSPQ